MDQEKNNNKNKMQLHDSSPGWLLYVFALLYIAASAVVYSATRAGGVIVTQSGAIPVASLGAALSSLSNIFIICLVVYFKKTGFIVSIVLLLLQFPLILLSTVTQHSLTSLPGLFSNLFTIIAVHVIYRRNKKIEEYQNNEVEDWKIRQKASHRLFEQTATALVNAIDAKDAYSRGHSLRVAAYSEKIARMMGKDEETCRKIYYSALLHDVGKIGIPSSIINKKGKLTDEEYEVIKQHPVMGNQILSSISEYPYLSLGAHYHHERYDGKGYPDGLKGEEIPELARIISVADAYDAMSSSRSYRDALPQDLVREEIVKGAGTQFDPGIAAAMQRLIDLDAAYQLKEQDAAGGVPGESELHCGPYRSEISDGIHITPLRTDITLRVTPEGDGAAAGRGPAIILFDALDGRVHSEEKQARDLCYFEYCEIWLSGDAVRKGARKLQTQTVAHRPDRRGKKEKNAARYEIEAVRCKDHALIRIDDGEQCTEVTVALPDSTRFAYIGLTGENCRFSDISIRKADEPVPADYIPRIADAISYINGPQGDIPNVQIDGFRTDASEGIRLDRRATIRFHTRSLPTARLIWHCPFFVLYHSDDGRVNGSGYTEYALIRLDGETMDSETGADNRLIVRHKEAFGGWDAWKEQNKAGYPVTAQFQRDGNEITMFTENLGIFIKNTTTLPDGAEEVYIALTGDQCALTEISAELE